MKKLLILVGVAVVAAAMYVAASPASRQSTGPTAKQFNALKKQVASLSKKLKTTKSDADATATIIATCYLSVMGQTATFTVLPLSPFGGINGVGYLYGSSASDATPRTALDKDNGPNPWAWLQMVNTQCATPGNRAVHVAASRVLRWAQPAR